MIAAKAILSTNTQTQQEFAMQTRQNIKQNSMSDGYFLENISHRTIFTLFTQ